MNLLADIFENGPGKYIFMSARVTAMMQQRKLFPWLLEKPLRMDGDPPYCGIRMAGPYTGCIISHAMAGRWKCSTDK